MYPLQEQGPARHKGRLPSRQTTKTSDLICLDVSRNCGRLMQARPFQCTEGKLLFTQIWHLQFYLHNILVSITWQARDKDNCRRKPSVPVDQSRGSPGLLNAPRKGQGKTLNVNRCRGTKKCYSMKKKQKIFNFQPLTFIILWVIHLNIKCLPSRRSSYKAKKSRLKTPGLNIFSG